MSGCNNARCVFHFIPNYIGISGSESNTTVLSTYIFLNGEHIFYHDCGYTSFSVRIDNATNIVKGGKNVLAVFVGWWYEGGDIYRNVGGIERSV